MPRTVLQARCFVILAAVVTLPAAVFGEAPPPLPKDTLPAELNLSGKRLGLPAPDPAIYPLSRDVVRLGRSLFFSPILSRDRSVSCASCHRPDHGFAAPDAVAVGIGGKVGQRNAPSLLNRAFGRQFFWDGRAPSLEDQALKPIENPLEMGHQLDNVVGAIRDEPTLVASFAAAFGTSGKNVDDATLVTPAHIAEALGTFQRTLLAGDSPIDRFRAGTYAALTVDEKQGLWIFESRGKCWQCHSGPNFSDEQFHNTGVGFGREDRDPGRFAVTKRKEDRFAFKTPTLRDVAHTAPYMHDGRTKTLEAVIAFYNAGGSRRDPDLDAKMSPLGLSKTEIGQLVAFLKALSSPPLDADGESKAAP